MGAEKRKNHRMTVDFPVKISAGQTVDIAGPTTGQAVDVSEKGVGVCLKKQVPLDTPINVFFNLAVYRNTAEVPGKIKWEHKDAKTGIYRYGVEFVQVEDSGKHSLAHVLSEMTVKHIEKIIEMSLPDHMRKELEGSFVCKPEQKQAEIINVIDFFPSVSCIERFVCFDVKRDDELYSKGLAIVNLSAEDKAKYDDAGSLISFFKGVLNQVCSIHIGALFPEMKADEEVEKELISQQIEDFMKEDIKKDSVIIIDTSVLDKGSDYMVMKANIYSENKWLAHLAEVTIDLEQPSEDSDDEDSIGDEE